MKLLVILYVCEFLYLPRIPNSSVKFPCAGEIILLRCDVIKLLALRLKHYSNIN